MLIETKDQFIFREEEFENENFNMTSLITKYNKILSLELLKEQLLNYSNSLKQQLYTIINRDYKDFITISTKLDGVDTRTGLLKKPLVDLRNNLNSLHDGILTSMQAVQEKLKYRIEIAKKRKLLELFMETISQLDIAFNVVNTPLSSNNSITTNTTSKNNNVSDNYSSSSHKITNNTMISKRNRLLSLLDQTLSLEIQTSINTSNSNNTSSETTTTTVAAISSQQQQQSDRYTSLLVQRDLLVCSEFERAAHCLVSVDTALQSLNQIIALYNTDELTITTNNNGPMKSNELLNSRHAITNFQKSLESQRMIIRDALVEKIRAHLAHMFSNILVPISSTTTTISTTNASTASNIVGTSLEQLVSINMRSNNASSTVSDDDNNNNSSNRSDCNTPLTNRSFAHCVRAMILLGKADTAENILRTLVFEPFLRSFLTHGRVDGKGGKGSFSGLEESLQSILTSISNSDVLLNYLSVAEEVANTTSTNSNTSESGSNIAVDFISHGIWLPIAILLSERFSDMFSIGIPVILSSCYRTINQFLEDLVVVLCKHQSYNQEIIRNRFFAHSSVIQFKEQWKLDLYFQLRCKEIFSRIDKACEVTLRNGLTSSRPNLCFDLYMIGNQHTTTINTTTTTTASNSNTTTTLSSSSSAVVVNSLSLNSPLECEAVRLSIAREADFKIPLCTVFAMELRTCLHSTVYLQPLVNKFLTLLLRIILRFEAHIAVVCNMSTPSFDKSTVEQLRLVYTTPTVTQLVPTTQLSVTTPLKTSTTTNTNSTTNTSSGTPGSTAVAAKSKMVLAKDNANLSIVLATTPGIDELVILCGDIKQLEVWLLGSYCTLALQTTLLVVDAPPVNILSENIPTMTSGKNDREDTDGNNFVTTSIITQVNKLKGCREEVWARIIMLIEMECKRTLSAVKAIAGKYRMTNKPTPDTASPYIETILHPIRDFVKQNNNMIDFLALPTVAASSIVKNITTTSNNTNTTNTMSNLTLWKVEVIEDVTVNFLEQVKQLLETVKQMDNALQRRSKLRTTTTTNATSTTSSNSTSNLIGSGNNNLIISDSDKITLQIRLDIEAYGIEIQSFGIELIHINSYNALKELVLQENCS